MARKHIIRSLKISSNRAFLIGLPILLVLAASVLFVTVKKNVTAAVGCSYQDLSGVFDQTEKFAFFQGNKMEAPQKKLPSLASSQVLGAVSEDRWIELDLSEQKLTAWEGGSVFLETPVSTGLPRTPTPTGEFRIWTKFKATKMEGGSGKYYYYLPNVPYTMFFEGSGVPGWKGYGLHGTYWHNDFGTQRSHGCVNLPTPIAERLFYWTGPEVLEGKSAARATAQNPGTKIVIHD